MTPRPAFSTPAACAIALLFAGPLSPTSSADDLYSNALQTDRSDPGLATGTLTASGAAAPSGKVWSELQATSTVSANSVAGFSGHDAASGFRFADDFAVSGVWSVDEIVFYAYSSDPLSPSPFAGVNLRIWQGEPEAPGSTVRFGDTTTSRLISATPTNMLRAFCTLPIIGAPLPSAPTTDRVIWQLRVSVSPPLDVRPGTLWLDWQIEMTSPTTAAFCPSLTVAARRTRAGTPTCNARQLRLSNSPSIPDAWTPLLDPGKPASAVDVVQDMPFIIRGSQLPSPCSPADIATDDGLPLSTATAQSSNNGVTEGDYNLFFAGFFDAAPWCDISNDDGSPLPPFGIFDTNNGVTEGDYNLFFSIYFNGCAF